MVACHTLWMWRNNEEHDDEFVRPFDPTYFIFQRQMEY